MLPTPDANRGSLQVGNPKEEVHNFSPGPSSVAKEVQQRIVAEAFNWRGMGLGVMELSHRSPEFGVALDEVRASLRRSMEIPDDFSILFTHGGGHGQFAAIPLNLAPPNSDQSLATVDYILSGSWSRRAASEASKFTNVHIVAESKTGFPEPETWDLSPDAKYVYFCSNETVEGVEVLPQDFPAVDKPLIVDMSSDMMLKTMPWDKVSLAFAICSKNLGIAGVGVVVIKTSLISPEVSRVCPGILNYHLNKSTNGMWNTPPTFNIWVVGLVSDYVLSLGGIREVEASTKRKMDMFVDCVEGSNGFYELRSVAVNNRKYFSRINLPFKVVRGNEEVFCEGARKRNLVGLRTLTPFGLGDLRPSFYLSVSERGVAALVAWMKEFQSQCEQSRL